MKSLHKIFDEFTMSFSEITDNFVDSYDIIDYVDDEGFSDIESSIGNVKNMIWDANYWYNKDKERFG